MILIRIIMEWVDYVRVCIMPSNAVHAISRPLDTQKNTSSTLEIESNLETSHLEAASMFIR